MSHPERSCTVCLQHDRRITATHVACAADGLEWFECGAHGDLDNDVRRVGLVPIADWFRRLPGRPS